MRRSTTSRFIAVGASLVTVGAMTVGFGPVSSAAPGRVGPSEARQQSLSAARISVDVRTGPTGSARAAAAADRVASASARAATARLAASLGKEGVVQMDATTGTVRLAGRLNGYLTKPSTASAKSVVLTYVRDHLAALGLQQSDLSTLRLTRVYKDIDGTRHLSWTQSAQGIPVFSNGLTAAVSKTGRLLMIGGAPVSNLQLPSSASSGGQKVTSAKAAIAASRTSLGEPAAAGPDDVATRVLFVTAHGTYLGWQTITMSATNPATTVVNGKTGQILYRRSLASDADPSTDGSSASNSSTGIAYRYFPGHKPNGGTADPVNFTSRGWLSAKANVLSGNNSHAYSDVNDDNVANPSEEVHPKSGHSWDYKIRPFHLKKYSFCDNPYPCTWNPNKPFSWKVNRAQNTSQVFFFVNRWHDHLQASPIGFTEAAGNFQAVNYSGHGKGGDPVDTQTDDGANTDNGLPDGQHIDNANMDTPPDGQSPRMQMYLQHQPFTSYPDGDPFSPTNVGDEADTVYHENTHGLSNRLVIDATGNSTLGNVEAGAMGEAWSDWYAMDYLVAHGLQKDVPNKTNIVIFQYDGAGTALDRTEPIDCKVGVNSHLCTGGSTGHGGGYTYKDYSHVIGIPEVHSDGEIWSQTLWDLRDRVGSKVAESLVTRAMELSPSNPSYIDERNAILMADTVVFGRKYEHTIWSVFANRGMGFYAGALSGDDSSPGADFHMPPNKVNLGFITGTITDKDSGLPVNNATVALAFGGGTGFENPSDVTGPHGHFRIGPVPVGHYRKLAVIKSGYNPTSRQVTVVQSGTERDVRIERDWAALTGGAQITDFNGPDFSPDCGPDGAIDQSQGTGWGSTTGDDNGDPTNTFVPKHIVVKLPKAIDVSHFSVDPSATCGDGKSASTAGFTIEVSATGSGYTQVASGTFTGDDVGQLNDVEPTGTANDVQYVRFTITSNQTPDFATTCPGGAFAGCSFTDLTELEVFGAPSS